MKGKILSAACYWLLLSALVGCRKDLTEPVLNRSQALTNRTVMVYMAANNDLRQEAYHSIDQMEMGASQIAGTLLVFVKTVGYKSHIIRIAPDTIPGFLASDTLKTYGSENSSDPTFMGRVFSDMAHFAPAREYGVVLWSHATSWAPPISKTLSLKSFGYDRGEETDIHDLKTALPDSLEFLLFDACSMGSIEVLYELKDKTKYIIASPTEVLSQSYPYKKVIPYLFGGVDNYMKVCSEFYNHYNANSGYSRSATVSLIDTRKLTVLANHTRELLESVKPGSDDYQLEKLQKLTFDDTSLITAYDFMDFITSNFPEDVTRHVSESLLECVVYRANTPEFTESAIKTYSGLGVSLPYDDSMLVPYYRKLEWYTAGGFNNLF